MRILIKLS